MMYTAPMSYESFLRSWEVKTNKLRWCYDYVRHPSQLEETSLPPREAWANWLRKEREPSEIEYRELQNFWRERRYANLRQFLAEYNAADVQGLIEAIRKMKLFWKSYNLDALKSAISLPGLAFESMLLYLHKEAPYTILQTMNSANADLFDCLRENLVAGKYFSLKKPKKLSAFFIHFRSGHRLRSILRARRHVCSERRKNSDNFLV